MQKEKTETLNCSIILWLEDCELVWFWIDLGGHMHMQDCQLHSIATRFGSIAAHGRKSPDEKTGFAFVRCRVTGTGPLYVGRAMGQYSRIVYSFTYFDDLVAHGGWDDWDHASNKNK